jgi:catechol 2,3-dioxygenase-like lactoylglutathione lyase family enzyme
LEDGEAMNLKLNHIQHIGIPVTNIKASEAFYEKLGFRNVMATTFEYNGGKGNVAMMKLGEMIIELYQMPEAELAEIRNRKNGHIDHIAFDVDDIDKTFEELKNAAFNVLEEQPVFLAFWKNGCRYFNITGPDGERIEFNQILASLNLPRGTLRA